MIADESQTNHFLSVEGVQKYKKLCDQQNQLFREEIHTQLRQVVAKGKRILELGSGAGHDLKLLSPIYSLTASDFSLSFLTLLRERFPGMRCLHLDVRGDLCAQVVEQWDKNSKFVPFDAIYSNKVFCYFSEPELLKSLRAQATLLLPGGFLLHTFWQQLPVSTGKLGQAIRSGLDNSFLFGNSGNSGNSGNRTNSGSVFGGEFEIAQQGAPKRGDGPICYFEASRFKEWMQEALGDLVRIIEFRSYTEEEKNDSILVTLQKLGI